MNIMGKKREMKFSDRPSSLEDAACDLVLILDIEQVVEGAKENFLTLISLGEGKIQLISEQSNDTNNFVWKRLEKQFTLFPQIRLLRLAQLPLMLYHSHLHGQDLNT